MNKINNLTLLDPIHLALRDVVLLAFLYQKFELGLQIAGNLQIHWQFNGILGFIPIDCDSKALECF